MKQVSGNIFVATIVTAVVLIGISIFAGMRMGVAGYEKLHGCTVDPTTKRATCTK